jgi:hypothetical protein
MPHAIGLCDMDFSGSYLLLLLLHYGYIKSQKWVSSQETEINERIKFIYAKVKQELISHIYCHFDLSKIEEKNPKNVYYKLAQTLMTNTEAKSELAQTSTESMNE